MKSRTIKKHLKPVGVTTEGRVVMGGAFFIADTVGLPLAEQLLQAEKAGMVVGLGAFIADAIRAGWSEAKAIREVQFELRSLGRWELATSVPERWHRAQKAIQGDDDGE